LRKTDFIGVSTKKGTAEAVPFFMREIQKQAPIRSENAEKFGFAG
jgi:hypothetical protein